MKLTFHTVRLVPLIANLGIIMALLPFPSSIAQDADTIVPGTYRLEKAQSSIGWAADYMGVLTTRGNFTDIAGTLHYDPAALYTNKLELLIGTASAHSFNSPLNVDMKGKDFFDVADYPEAKFVATDIDVISPGRATILGNFTLRGITKPIEIETTFHTAPNAIYFKGDGIINRSDYGITAYNSVLEDEVKLDFTAEFVALQ